MPKCSQCRIKNQAKEHHPYCSFECWERHESGLSGAQIRYRDKKHHKAFQDRLDTRDYHDADEHKGLIMQMISKAKENNHTTFRYRCHSCAIGIRDEAPMIHWDGWFYCNEECMNLALTDEQAIKNRSGFSHED